MTSKSAQGGDTVLVVVATAVCIALVLTIFGVALAVRKTPAASTTATTAPIASEVGVAVAVDVQLNEFNIGLPATTLTPGVKTLRITNTGTVQHELLVFRSDLAPSAYPLDHGDINEDGPGVTKVSDGDNIDPGKRQTRTVDLSTPGTYLFVCNLPGHFGQGMYKVVTVGPTPDTVAVTLSEFKVVVAGATLPTGTATLSITNAGSVQHELLVFATNLAPRDFPVDPDGTVQEDGAGMNKVSDGDNIDPGRGQTRTVDLTKPGTYVLVCNLPGHFRSGMYTTVTVR